MAQTLWGETRTGQRRHRRSRQAKAEAPYSITGANDCEIIGHTLSHWSLAGTTTCMDCGAAIFCPDCTPQHPTDPQAVALLCPRHESEARHDL